MIGSAGASTTSFIDVFDGNVDLRPNQRAIIGLAEGWDEPPELTYAELRQEAYGAARQLLRHASPGDRVLISLDSGLAFVVAFLGCLYAGLVAVPAAAADAARGPVRDRLLGILRSASPRVVIAEQEDVARIFDTAVDARVTILTPASLRRSEPMPRPRAELGPDTIAFLQFTSGSTAEPRGVIVTHRNLVANETAIRNAFGLGDADVVVSWLPLFHDMGLVGGVLAPLFSGSSIVLMSPRQFLERPVRWLQAISRWRGTVSGAPDFAFRLCADRISSAQLKDLDLSCWQLAFCGAEPIAPTTLSAFAERFQKAGFQRSALYPCYGLAEATLFVSGGRRGGGARYGRLQGHAIVSCGVPFADIELCVVDEAGAATAGVGEILVGGASVSAGYWEDEDATRDTFVQRDGRRFLRTGDLGFVEDSQLYIAGRIKDLIIIRGQNIYPQDIERVIEAAFDVLLDGRVVVFAVDDDGREAIAVVAEVARRKQRQISPDTLCDEIRELVAAAYLEAPTIVVLAQQGAVPRTSSGKLQRRKCRELWQSGKLDSIHVRDCWHEEAPKAGPTSASGLAATIGEVWCSILGLETLAPDSNFFAAGGTSVSAAQMVARLSAVLALDVKVDLLFQNQSLNAFTAAVAGLPPSALAGTDQQKDAGAEGPLSSAQERQWFLWRIDPESSAYNVTGSVRLHGRLSETALQGAVDDVVARHGALRTTFHDDGHGTPFQRVHARMDIRIDRLVACQTHESGALVGQEIARLGELPFDLESGPLIRLGLTARGDDDHVLVVSLHHIVADATSMLLVMDELARSYSARLDGGTADLPELPLEFIDLCRIERNWLGGDDYARQLGYWVDRLAGAKEPLTLPADLRHEAGVSPSAGSERIGLCSDLTADIRAFARARNTTTFAVLLAAFHMLLYRYTGQAEVAVGVPTAGRTRPGSDRLIGLFVNTVVVAVDVDGQTGFSSLLSTVTRHLQDALLAQDVPLERLVDALRPDRHIGRNPLFQVLVNHRALPRTSDLARFAGLDIRDTGQHDSALKFDLSLDLLEAEDGIDCAFRYSAQLYRPETMAQLTACYHELIRAALENPTQPIDGLRLVGAQQYRTLVDAWARGEERRHGSGTLHQAIAAMAARHPEAIALVFEDRRLTYRALNAKANQLGRFLRSRGVGAETLVGIFAERSIELVVGILAVLKAGGAYVPIDPVQPAERISLLLRDSGVELVLTQASLIEALPSPQSDGGVSSREIPHWSLDSDWQEVASQTTDDLSVEIDSENIAYCIYTSGSTGRPKGAVVTHRAIFNRLEWMRDAFAIGADDRILLKTPFDFDVSVWEIFLPLMSGAQLVVAPPRAHTDPETLAALVVRHGITAMHFVPSMLGEFLGFGPRLDSVRLLVCSGEALSVRLQSKVLERAKLTLANLYGPTEAAIDVSWWLCSTDPTASSVPIGRPIWNAQLYVLDKDLNPLPTGVVGELYIGGTPLARGYRNASGLTAERFLPDPFSRAPGARIYRTGDLVRWRPDGAIEYVGRADHQVKIRGMRVELGEIEAQISARPGVREAVANVYDGAARMIVAYVVLADSAAIDTGRGAAILDDIKAALRSVLPGFMVPARLVLLDKLPLLANGKLDRKALPAPDFSRPAAAGPANDVERALALIWQDVLHLPSVGVEDDFFALGGDSILSLQVVARARLRGLLLRPRDLFSHQTIRDLATIAQPLAPEAEGEHADTEPDVGGRTALVPSDVALSGLSQAQIDALPFAGSEIEDVYGLSPMQHGMLFHALHAPEAGHYVNQLSVTARGLDVARFEASWRSVVARHAVLRTSFVWGADVPAPLQIVHKSVPAAFAVVDRRDDEAADLAALARDERRRGFDLGRAPLQRMMVVLLPGGRACLIWTHHHLLTDGWSTARQIEEAFAHYLGEPLAPVRGRYRDYIAWLGRQDKAAGEGFWRAQLAGLETPSLLAEAFGGRAGADAPTGDAADGHVRLVHRVDAAGRARLQRFAQAERITLNTLVQGAWTLLLQRLCGQASVVFGSTVAGRPAELAGSQEMLGLFINTLPVIQAPRPEQSVGAFLRALQEAAIAAREYEHVPLYDIQRWSGRPGQPLFDTVLVFENYPIDAALRQRSDQTLRFEDVRPVNPNSLGLTLNVDVSDGLVCTLIFAEARFGEPARRTILQGWSHLLEQLVADAARPLGALSLLPEAARRRRAGACRGEVLAAPAATVPALFASWVARCPDAPAVVCGGVSLSYGALAARARRLAGRLRRHGVGPERLVGLLAERSLEMVVGVLAILEAGGAYVPLDPSHPPRRLAQLLAEAAIDLVVGTRAATAPLAGHATPIVLDDDIDDGLDDDWAAAAARAAAPSEPGAAATAQNLAYVIFTSGSTGRPKGVAVTHGALVDYVRGIEARLGLGAARGMALVSTPAADLGHTVLYGALCSGGALHVVDADTAADAARFAAYLRAHRIDVVKIAASHLVGLGSAAGGFEDVLPRRALIVGGEALDATQATRLLRVAGGCRLYNHYGPTEATVGVTTFAVPPDWAGDALPLGAALPNVEAHILSAELDPVPVAVTGELYLGGPGLARGYHRRPGLTAERFVPNPFSTEPGARLYRTGDLARQRHDGTIAYAGRADRQIKLRGYRVELGEIEARLLAHAAVREAVVVARPARSDKQLVGYVVTRTAPGAQAGDVAEDVVETLRAHLAAGLPDHMVPTHLVVLDKLPLTANGKLDRAALPEPDMAAREHVAPQTDIEKTLAAIWRDVLALETIGVTDNFFELGGDSILSLQIVGRARKQGLKITPKQLFEQQTIRQLARVSERRESRQARAADQVTGPTDLTPIQHGFFAMDIPCRDHWNQSVLLEVSTDLDPSRLEMALQTLVLHHDALRLRFHQNEAGVWNARHAEPEGVRAKFRDDPLLWLRDAASADLAEAAYDEAQRSLSLGDGPLLRGVFVRFPGGSRRLLLIVHHLVVDAVSWRILLEDLQTLYAQGDRGPAGLPTKTTSFQAWSKRLKDHAVSGALDDEAAYWQAQSLAQPDSPLLRRTGVREVSKRRDQKRVSVALDVSATTRLLRSAAEAYRTQINDLLLTGLAMALCSRTNASSVVVNLEGHGREDLFDGMDVSRTVGWFTSLFPIRLTPAHSLESSIKQIKEQLRAVPTKGLGFGLLRYEGTVAVRQRLAAVGPVDVTFNYLGQLDHSLDARGLFRLAGERGGESRDPEARLDSQLTIEGRVYGGALEFQFLYDPQVFGEEAIADLAADYVDQIDALARHCALGDVGGPTPSDVPLARLTQAQLDALPIAGRNIEDVYPLSPMQIGILFEVLHAPEMGHYVNQLSVGVSNLDIRRFTEAVAATFRRHSVLRTSFAWGGDLRAPVQIVSKSVEAPVTFIDWSDRPHEAADVERLAAEQYARGFDLRTAPLQRMSIVRLRDGKHHLVWTYHHLLTDGWSSGREIEEIFRHYLGETLPPPVGRYRDHIALLERGDLQASERFWREAIAPLDEPTLLAHASSTRRPARARERGAEKHGCCEVDLPRELVERVRQFVQRERVTLNTLVQGAWLALLQRYCGQDVVAFGAIIAGRPSDLPEAIDMLGLFINTIPVVATWHPDMPAGDWLRSLQNDGMTLQEHGHVPLYDIQRWAGRPGQPLFDSILVFENYPIDRVLRQRAGAELAFHDVSKSDPTSYPMTVLVDVDDGLKIALNYLSTHFAADDVVAIRTHLVRLLEWMVAHPMRRLGTLDVLDVSERDLLVRRWARGATVPLRAQCLHTLFEAQVAERPDAVAVAFGETSLTYDGLNRRANQLSRYLRRQGVGCETMVGLAVERSLDLLVGLMGILKAGAAYVPLDSSLPGERVAFMVADAGVRLVVTQAAFVEKLDEGLGGDNRALRLVSLDEDWKSIEREDASNPINQATPGNLAYCIYTSGSTGRPKGVAVDHHGVINRLQWMRSGCRLGVCDRVLQKTPLTFDVSVWELFWPLTEGGTLVVAAPGAHRRPAELRSVINGAAVTVAHFVPSMLQAFVEAGELAHCGSLEHVMCSGEALPAALRNEFRRQSSARLHNLYGPTETSIEVTHWDCTDGDQDSVPIGRPIWNTSLFVLSSDMILAPIGAVGELYIGGVALARGYHGRGGLTAERFVPNPFAREAGERLYRTGDLARWRPDGVIEYVGRVDHQVKIRGFRIELGEIRACLLAHREVKDAVVTSRAAASGRQLVGYVVLRTNDPNSSRPTVTPEELSAHLRQHLPEYMVPPHLVALERLPLTASGKVDLRALPEPVAAAPSYVAPRNELERRLASIWEDVLGVEPVGVTQSFFELGGDSISAIRLVTRIVQAGYQVEVRQVFEAETISRLAEIIGPSLTQESIADTVSSVLEDLN